MTHWNWCRGCPALSWKQATAENNIPAEKKSFPDKQLNDKFAQKWHLSWNTGKMCVNVDEGAVSVQYHVTVITSHWGKDVIPGLPKRNYREWSWIQLSKMRHRKWTQLKVNIEFIILTSLISIQDTAFDSIDYLKVFLNIYNTLNNFKRDYEIWMSTRW